MASRSVDSNFVPAGARNRSWNWLTPPAGKISRPSESPIATTTATVTAAYAMASSQRAGARRCRIAPRRSRSRSTQSAACVAVRSRSRVRLKQPDRQNRHERAREQEGRDHREADGQRQRNKERARHAGHEERRDEHRDHGQHGEQARPHDFARSRPARRGRRARPGARCVWMFSIATVASSTRMPTASARPPSVMTLIVWPAPQSAITARQQRERDRDDDDAGAAPVAQKDQHHQSGQQRANRRFAQHRLKRRRNVPRLIELVADLDVVGHQRLESAEVGLDLAHHAQCRRVRAVWSPECRRRGGRSPARRPSECRCCR